MAKTKVEENEVVPEEQPVPEPLFESKPLDEINALVDTLIDKLRSLGDSPEIRRAITHQRLSADYAKQHITK